MKTYMVRLRYVIGGILIGWLGSKILNHNNWGEKPIVNDITLLAIVLVLLITIGYSLLNGKKAYKELRKPEPSAEELAGIKAKTKKA